MLLRTFLFLLLVLIQVGILFQRAFPAFGALSVFLEVQFQIITITIKAKHSYRGEDVLPTDCLSLLVFALLACLAGDERDELGNALLDSLLRIFGNFGILGQSLFHNATDVSNGQKPGVAGDESTWKNIYLSALFSSSGSIQSQIKIIAQRLKISSIYYYHISLLNTNMLPLKD